MSSARKVLIAGGLALALWGMSFGLWYAVWVEHQTLDAMGSSLAAAFGYAAERNLPAAHASLDSYSRTAYVYVRQVDVHSHWIGLAMLLLALGIVFDRVDFAPRGQFFLAITLTVGAVIFPLGVFLQTVSSGSIPSLLAILGSGLVIAALSATTVGFLRSPSSMRDLDDLEKDTGR